MIIHQTKIQLFTGIGVPQEAVENAQVAFVSECTWSIVAPYKRLSGVHGISTMPLAYCPLVDTRNIADDEAMAASIRKHLRPQGVDDLEQLLAELEGLGAAIRYPVEVQA
ncbi:MAG: hypothetical protein ACOYYS_10120 [Chloroflexota bacterium]